MVGPLCYIICTWQRTLIISYGVVILISALSTLEAVGRQILHLPLHHKGRFLWQARVCTTLLGFWRETTKYLEDMRVRLRIGYLLDCLFLFVPLFLTSSVIIPLPLILFIGAPSCSLAPFVGFSLFVCILSFFSSMKKKCKCVFWFAIMYSSFSQWNVCSSFKKHKWKNISLWVRRYLMWDSFGILFLCLVSLFCFCFGQLAG